MINLNYFTPVRIQKNIPNTYLVYLVYLVDNVFQGIPQPSNLYPPTVFQ